MNSNNQRPKIRRAFKKARTIAPLHTGGPVSITQNGLWLVTCVGEQALLTDLQRGAEICRFAGVPTQSLSPPYALHLPASI
jgi:U3 small nucleolar RNA-associated protein 13